MECNVPTLSLTNIPDHSGVIAESLAKIDGSVCEQASNAIVKSVFKDINGLVHFVHMNRSNGRAIVPRIDTTTRNGMIIKQQVSRVFYSLNKQETNKRKLIYVLYPMAGMGDDQNRTFVPAGWTFDISLAGPSILLFIFLVVRRQSWHAVEAQRNAKHDIRCNSQAAENCRHFSRGFLSVSIRSSFQSIVDTNVCFHLSHRSQ